MQMASLEERVVSFRQHSDEKAVWALIGEIADAPNRDALLELLVGPLEKTRARERRRRVAERSQDIQKPCFRGCSSINKRSAPRLSREERLRVKLDRIEARLAQLEASESRAPAPRPTPNTCVSCV